MAGDRVGRMKKDHVFSLLAGLLVLLTCVCGVSANTLTLGNANLQNVGDTGWVDLSLDAAPPQGLAGYSVTFTIIDSSIADITDVRYPGWVVQGFSSRSPGTNNVNIRVADVGDAVNAQTPGPIYLGSVQVQGLAEGTTDISVTANEVDAEDGSPVNLSVTKSSIAVQLPPGSIQVTCTPVSGAQVYLDGVLQSGKLTDTTLDGVTPGPHKVRVTYSGYASSPEKDVTVESGQTATISFALVKTGSFKVTSTPSGANIILDNAPTGQTTPYTLTGLDPTFAHLVRVELPGYYGKETSKKPTPGVTVTVSFTLTWAGNDVAPYGNISIGSVPDGAEVFIDGSDAEAETPANIQIDPGPHTVSVALAGYGTPAGQTVTVATHKTVTVNFDLKKNPPIPIPEFPTSLVPLIFVLVICVLVVFLKNQNKR